MKTKQMKTKPLTYLLALTFLFFVGCQTVGGRIYVGPPIQFGSYVQSNTTERELSRDTSQCSSLSNVGNPHYGEKHSIFHLCMVGKGWDFVDEKGNPTKRDLGKTWTPCTEMHNSFQECKKK
jgi:hypothetical protein